MCLKLWIMYIAAFLLVAALGFGLLLLLDLIGG